MTKKAKRIISIVIVSIIVLVSSVLIFFSCAGTGKFYSLRDAYEAGYLTKEQIQEVANYHNNGLHNNDMDLTLSSQVKNSWARYLKENSDTFSDIKANDIDFKHYGTYGKYSVVMMYYGHNADQYAPTDVEIDGIVFHFGHYNTVKDLVVYVKF